MSQSELKAEELRLVQAMYDFQQALSAWTFFIEVPDSISEVEGRRFRCFHDMMAINYWRPFSASSGLPKISFKKLRISLSSDQKRLHNRIRDYRNKIVAHTDEERMRIALKAHSIEGLGDKAPRLPAIAFDRGFEFYSELREVESWLRIVVDAAAHSVYDLVQSLPPDKEFRKNA